jgi:predicted Zn-dependent protease
MLKQFNLLFCLIITISIFGQASKNISYDFSCMESADDFSWFINAGSEMEKTVLKNYGSSVSIEEEQIVGDSLLMEIKKKYVVIQNDNRSIKLNSILSKLVDKINSPRGFEYQIYLIQSDELNAFTVGGKIFFTSSMYDFCISDDERACIVGHEISHNELGHINENLSRMKTAGEFGQIGQISSSIATLLTTSFNQKNETHCDFVGIDLAQAAGFKSCSSISLWERMMKSEGPNVKLGEFFSSHPYSGKRAICSKNHLKINYSINCPN